MLLIDLFLLLGLACFLFQLLLPLAFLFFDMTLRASATKKLFSPYAFAPSDTVVLLLSTSSQGDGAAGAHSSVMVSDTRPDLP
jgi:hypothetical protein